MDGYYNIVAGFMSSIVIALGGNALLAPFGKQSFAEENKNIDRVSKIIARMCKGADYDIVITHGNGSQVGDELLRNEHAKKYVPKMPLYILNAETQASIGTTIETSLTNELGDLKVKKGVCVVLAHVLVEEHDAAFRRPSKPIGPYYTENELHEELRSSKFDYAKLDGGYRKVVASPAPKAIVEIGPIKAQAKMGIVITCGGGGVPVIKRHGRLVGIDAVIDKDLTSQLLATQIGAEKMVILTGAEYIYSDHHTLNGPIKQIRAKDIKKRIGAFEEGTIRPKIEACIKFIENGGKEAYIGNVFKLEQILKGKSGTRIY